MTVIARIGRLFAAAACIACALPALGHELRFKSLFIGHPHVFEPQERLPKAVPMFMVIRNEGNEPDKLIGAETTFAASASIATGGSGSPVAGGIPLPAASEVTLRPSTAHLVLHDIKESLEGYQYFPLTLVFERAGKVEVEVYVEDRP